MGAAEPLATRRASRTRVEGAVKAVDVANDARTGANIRGSSMAVLLLEKAGVRGCNCDFSRYPRGPCANSASLVNVQSQALAIVSLLLLFQTQLVTIIVTHEYQRITISIMSVS